jgi:hypothetical protein
MRPAATCQLIDVSIATFELVKYIFFQLHAGKPHFTASDYENVLVPGLPGHNQGSSALDFREFLRHSGRDREVELLVIVVQRQPSV